jgi:hypothetical protein
LSHGSFGDTILLSILNKFTFPGWLSLVGDHHLGRFLRLYYVMVLYNILIRGSYDFPHWFYNFGSYMFLFIYFFKMASS